MPTPPREGSVWPRARGGRGRRGRRWGGERREEGGRVEIIVAGGGDDDDSDLNGGVAARRESADARADACSGFLAPEPSAARGFEAKERMVESGSKRGKSG